MRDITNLSIKDSTSVTWTMWTAQNKARGYILPNKQLLSNNTIQNITSSSNPFNFNLMLSPE